MAAQLKKRWQVGLTVLWLQDSEGESEHSEGWHNKEKRRENGS
jgi:hypothetical protein